MTINSKILYRLGLLQSLNPARDAFSKMYIEQRSSILRSDKNLTFHYPSLDQL